MHRNATSLCPPTALQSKPSGHASSHESVHMKPSVLSTHQPLKQSLLSAHGVPKVPLGVVSSVGTSSWSVCATSTVATGPASGSVGVQVDVSGSGPRGTSGVLKCTPASLPVGAVHTGQGTTVSPLQALKARPSAIMVMAAPVGLTALLARGATRTNWPAVDSVNPIVMLSP